MKKRLLSIILTLVMIIGLIPSAVLAADIGSGTDANTAGNLLETMKKQNTTEPKGFKEDTLSPYGTEVGQNFNMMENSELLTYVTWETNLNGKHTDFTYENYNGSNIADDTSLRNEDGLQMSNSANVLSYSQAVAFDPTGSGKRSYIAVLGYNETSGCAEVWFSDTSKQIANGTGQGTLLPANANSNKPLVVKLYDCSWFKNATDKAYGIDTVDAKNFLQITAGDYDKDGKDTLIVYCGEADALKSKKGDYGQIGPLTEISLSTNSAKNEHTVKTRALSGNFFSTSYMRFISSNADKRKLPYNRLGVALETGDVNGDNIDDLVVLSYLNDADVNVDDIMSRSARLTVGYGKKGDKNIFAEFYGGNTFIYNETDNPGEYRTMVSAGVSIGDIDGDGYNEVVTAGFVNLTKANDLVNIQNDGRFAFAYFNCEKGSPVQAGKMVEVTDCSPICYGKSMRANERIWQQFSVECVAFDGINSQEFMFLNGYIYKLNEDGEIKRADDLTYFQGAWYGEDKKDKRVMENFIYSTAVGSFLNMKSGKESIVMTVGYKYDDTNAYTFRKIWIHPYAGSTVEKVGLRMEGDTGSDAVLVTRRWDHCQNDRLNCFVVACDYDDDSVIAKYKGKTYAYTDPNVVAVLQAAPYFEEFDPGNSSTTYGYSESYVVAEGNGFEFSASVGVAADIEAGAIKETLEAGYSTELIREYMESRETTYTTTFEANGENQVILRRTLVYIYDYEIATKTEKVYDKTSGKYIYDYKWQDCGLVVTVPQYPVMSQLSIEQYDDFAKAYNKEYGVSKADKDKGLQVYNMDVIGDKAGKYYLDENEGNPFAYAEYYTDYANGMELTKSSWIELSHSGGTSQLGYDTSLTKEQSRTRSDGGYFNMTLMGGAGIGSFSFYAGVSTSLEMLSSSTVSTATITGTNTSGTVQNLDSDYTDYHFNWKLIGWKTTGDFFKDVLFVGYAVRGQSAPLRPVEDLSAVYNIPTAETNETVTLSWTSPEARYGRNAATKFDVYRVLPGGEYEKLATVNSAGVGKTNTYTVDVSEYRENYVTFTVVAVSDKAGDINSHHSNEAICFLVSSYKEITDIINGTKEELQTKIDDLRKTLESGQADAIAKAVKELTDAYKKADSELDAAIKASNESLKTEIKTNTEDLESDIKTNTENLNAEIKANAEELNKKLDELREAMELADNVINSILADQELKNAMYDELIKNNNELINSIDNAYKDSDSDLKALIEALKKELSELRSEKNADLDALRKEKDNEISALRQEKNDDIAALKAELAALKGQVTENKNKSEESVEALTTVNNTQEDNLGTLRTVSRVGVGVAGVSLLGNIALFVLNIIQKKKML